MKKRLLLAYQILTGLSDTSTGVLLLFAPFVTMRLMKLHPAAETLPFLSYIGAFVLSVGITCFYGALLTRRASTAKLEVVWLVTALTRLFVASFVTWKVMTGILEPGWTAVAFSDGALALFQIIGLAKGWIGAILD